MTNDSSNSIPYRGIVVVLYYGIRAIVAYTTITSTTQSGSNVWNVTGVPGINIIGGNYWSEDADAVLILQMAACGTDIDPAADVNSGGTITSLDVLMVSQAVMKGVSNE